MKIKSGATGEMVEARVGMDAEVITSCNLLPPVTGKISGLGDDGEILTLVNGNFSWTGYASRVKMLHCPFQVGDEVEAMFNDGQWRHIPHRYGDDALDYVQAKNGHIRHANPSLRDAPEHKL